MPLFAKVLNNRVIEISSVDKPGFHEVQEQEHEMPDVQPGWGYSPQHQVFVSPRFKSWTFDPETLNWIPPVSPPDLDWPQVPRWNEDLLEWEILDLAQS